MMSQLWLAATAVVFTHSHAVHSSLKSVWHNAQHPAMSLTLAKADTVPPSTQCRKKDKNVRL